MTQDDLTRYAIQKTVKMLADCGFKYRKLELANTKRELDGSEIACKIQYRH